MIQLRKLYKLSERESEYEIECRVSHIYYGEKNADFDVFISKNQVQNM